MPKRFRLQTFLNLSVVISLILSLAAPVVPAAAAPVAAATFTPPIESRMQGASQASVSGPLGLDVSIYDLSLRSVRTDFFLPGCVVPLQATFIYEQTHGDSPFGYGWRFVYGASYAVQEDGSLIIGPINGRMQQFSPGDGHLVRTEPGRYQLHLDDGNIYYFDNPENPQVTKIEGQGGGYLTLAYGASGEMIRITDHFGRHLDFSYNNGKLSGITDANAVPARTTQYSYDANGNLITVSDPLGNMTLYAFNAAHQLRRVTGPSGNWAAITYVREQNVPTEFPDGVGQISTPLGAISFVRKIVYKIPSVGMPVGGRSPVGPEAAAERQILANFASVTDVVGGQQRTTTYHFSPWTGQLDQIIDPLGAVTQYGRDGQGNQQQITNENGDVTSYLYDTAGQLIQSTDPLARVTSYSYNDAGQVAAFTDPRGQTTRYQYDAAGNVIRVTDPLGSITSYAYDAKGKPVSATDPLSNTLRYTYDAFGFPASVTDGAGVSAAFSYNARGDLLQVTDGLARTTRYGHDALGRVISITNPAGELTQLAYDANGLVTQLIDPTGRIVKYSRDATGRLIRLADALGATSYTYDAAGNITVITDGQGNQDQFTYDLNGRLTSRSDGLNRPTLFNYDPAGNLTRRTDAVSSGTVYTYSAANQLTAVGYPDGTTASFTYDAAGNLLQEANDAVTVDYTYDPVNRLASVIAAGKTISYTYDAAGRRASMTDPDGNQTSYTYDAAGRLGTVSDPLAGTISYTYDAAGNLARLDRANGVYSLYTYDAANRLQTISHHAAGGAVLDSFSYSSDNAGNRTNVTSAKSGTTTYTYDDSNQLTGVTYPGGGSTTYSYDSAGNRLSENTTAYSYDASAQLLNVGTTAFNWDTRGNQVGETGSGVNTVFSYDHENRLTGGSFADNSSLSYTYYPDGRLFSRTSRAGQTTHFFYDGPNLLLETDGSGSTQARYTNGLNLDAWLAMQRGGQSYDYLHDALNSVTGLTDSSGALAASYQYDAYGSLQTQTGSVPNPFRFTGRYWDTDAGLYQYRARWYDPDTGRFISRDPLGPLNVRQMYAYADNNPSTYVDPLGLDTWNCDSGSFSIGLVIGGEWSNLRCENAETHEVCSLKQWCVKAGLVGGAHLGGCGIKMKNGPVKGDDLGGGSFGWTVGASAGVGVGVGGSISGDTGGIEPSEDKTRGSATGSLCAGVGEFGASASLGGQYCRTTVLSCTRPPEPKPKPPKPPYRPGGDHADDNYSAASPSLPLSTNQLPTSHYALLDQSPISGTLPLVGHPRVGIFWHGYAEEAQALLASWGWESTPVDINFAPAALDLPVLFIPSGGLYGLETAGSVRSRLEAYTADGGVIIALAQQHGYEFASLPGGQLKGYGWSEDNSCFDASLYVSQYHPLLSGFSRPTLTSGVDGFFTSLPDGAQTLLNRSRDGQPGLALYPYQSGWVAAASLYDDWGGANYQPPADSARLLRDLLSWGVNANEPLPEFSPAMTATVPITVANGGLLASARIRFQTVDPDGEVVMTRTVDLPLPAGGLNSQTIQQADLPPKLGIWWVQYTLLDADDNVVQPAVWGGRFAVSNPSPAAGPGKEMSLSITAPTENFVPGTATFTFHVRNFTDSPRPATVAYGFPHHTWETGDPIYGNFSNLTRAVIVPPQSEITFTHSADILTNDRLFAFLTAGVFSQQAWFQIRTAPAAVGVDLSTDAEAYRRGQTVPVTVTLNNLQSAAYQVTLNLKATDSQGTILYQGQQSVAMTGAAAVVTPLTFTLSTTAAAGTAVFSAVAQDANGSNLNAAQSKFTILDSPLTFGTALPNTFTPGASQNLLITATNNSAAYDVLTATLAVTITSPDGSALSLPSQPFTLAAAQTTTLTAPFTVPQAQFGRYTFDFTVVDEYGQHVWTVYDLNEPVLSSRFDRTTYASGETVHMEVTVENSGHWSQNLDILIAPLIAAAITIPLAVEPGEPASITVDIPLPTSMAAGSYPFTSTLIPPAGNSRTNRSSIMVPDADLRSSMASRLLTAGTPISVTVSNSGGADTGAGYFAWLRDAGGITVQTITGTLAAISGGGGSDSFAFPVPAAAVSGSYALGGVVTNSQASLVEPFTFLVTVDGTEAQLTAETEQAIYNVGQPISATASISNTGLSPINNAALDLAVDAAPAWTWFTHRPGQQGPSSGASLPVTDTAGILWMRTQRAINAFDDGGTPSDETDDRWQLFDTLSGLPRPYAYHVFADAAGYKWISSGQGGADTLSVLDDGGTPFDLSDDQWLHYTSAGGFPGIVLAQDAAGNLWINESFAGVSVLDPGADPMSKSDDRWARFSTADGLASNAVSVIRIDAGGYKWFATNNGASALDDGGDPFDGAGDAWHSFFVGSGLPDNSVKGMDIDANGRVWFAGGGTSFAYDIILGVLDTGASPVDGTGDIFNTFAPPSGSLYGIVTGFGLDQSGRAWFGLPSSKIGYLDTGPDPFDVLTDTWGSIASPYLAAPPMVPAGGNAYWLASGSGLQLFDDGGTPISDTDDSWQLFNKDAGIGNYNVAAIAPGEGGMTWFGSESNGPLGLRVLDPMGTPTDPFDDQWMSFYAADGLPNDRVSGIAVGQLGRVWTISNKAAVLDHNGTPFDKADDSWQTFEEADIGLGGLYDLAIDSADRKWFAGWSSSNTYGLTVLDDAGTPITKTDDLAMTFPIAGMTSNEVNALAIDQNGVKWMVTWAEVAALDDGGTPFNTADDLTQRFSPYSTNHYPSNVAVDGQNNIWIAYTGNSGGVAVLDYNGTLTNTADDTWRNFYTFNGLADNWVFDLAVDAQGDKWFATDSGLSRLDDGGNPFDGVNDSWESFTTEIGLGYTTAPQVAAVAVGGDGHIWAGTFENGASVGIWQGTAVWSAQQPISSLPSAAATQLITSVIGLAAPGRYLLRGEFTNDLGQTLAADRSSFYIVSGQTGLTLDAAPDPVRAGASITLTGALVNNGAAPLTSQTIWLYQDGTLIRSEGPFDLAAYSSHPFTTTATAPSSGESSGFTAAGGGHTVELNVVVGRPQINASAAAAAVVGSDPFTVTISLTNTGVIAGQVQLSVGSQQQTVTVPPGETVLAQAAAQVCADAAVPVELSGDLTQTLNVPVNYGQALVAAFSPQPIYPSGVLTVPYAFSGSGQLDVTFTTAVTIHNSLGPVANSQFDNYLIASDVITGSSVFELPAGSYDLTYHLGAGDCSLDSGQESFVVAPAAAAAISVTIRESGPEVPITATVTNRGSSGFSGGLELITDYGYQLSQPFTMTVGASKVVTFTVDAALAPAGVHTATVRALTGAGTELAQDAVYYTVQGPLLNVTSLPNQTTLPVSQTVTMTFGVSNQGDQGEQATFRFSLGDIEEETQVRRIAAGETEQFDFAFFVPQELEAKDYLATYELNRQRGELLLTIQGISLTITAAADQPAYRQGAPAQLQLTIENNQATTEPGLYALVSLGGLTQTQPFTLSAAPVNLNFPLTATFGSGGLVFYGIYHGATQRGIHLNTFRLPQQQEAVTVLLDQGVYAPGAEVQAAVVTTATGQLEISAPGYTTTLSLSGSDSQFSFTLPDPMKRGSHAVSYRLTGCDCDQEGRMYQAVFDLSGPLVRVTESRLGEGLHLPGDMINLRLTVASDRSLDTVLESMLIYPDGRKGAVWEQVGTLLSRPNNALTGTVTISDTQAGLYLLNYRMVDANEKSLVLAAGVEAFDVGPASLLDFLTDRTAYDNADDPVTAGVRIYASQPVSGLLSLVMDGGVTQQQTVSLTPGRQTVTMSLNSPIATGQRILTATLTVGGLSSQSQVTFTYGAAMADLHPSQPWVEAGGIVSRTVRALVANQGGSTAAATTARFFDGDPDAGGVLIGTAAVPPLGQDDQIDISAAWDIQGLGGEHLIVVTVDPVVEQSVNNNAARVTLSLPAFAAGLAVSPPTLVVGDEAALRVDLVNLQTQASLPVTATVDIVSPGGAIVHTQAWSITLGGGSEQQLNTVWSSGPASLDGGYLVNLLVQDALGNVESETAFILVEQPTGYSVYLPIIVNGQAAARSHQSKRLSSTTISPADSLNPLAFQRWPAGRSFLTLLMLLAVVWLAVRPAMKRPRQVTRQLE